MASTLCHICGIDLTLKSRNSRYVHKQSHKDEESQCQECDLKFSNSFKLKKHMYKVYVKIEFSCDRGNCGMVFKNYDRLNKHIT